jgi:hypothetical protein
MATLGVRHLPVVGDGRQLGMLSIRDLLGTGPASAAIG